MKKILSSMVAIASMLVLGTSCSSEEVAPVTGESTVTLSVTLPDGIQSRTFGDGTTAQKLTMLVLDQDNKVLSVFNNGTSSVLNAEIQLKTQVNLKLAAGKTYKVVCWAAAEGAPYSFDTTNFKVSANYTDATKTSDETLDAFYAVQSITVQGNTSETVKLYRPFAQLNIGTDDLKAAAAAGFEAKTVTVTVPTYKSLNLLTGEVEPGDPVAQTFAANDLPTGEKFPKTGYDYLSMNYILMSTDKQLVDIEFTVNAADGKNPRTLPVTGVPVQRNYRTNIYGSLLTNNVNINVEIVPDFEKPDYYVYDENTLAAAINAGKNVTLYSDIELTAPIYLSVGGTGEATLDLNGHKIYNEKEIYDSSENIYAMFRLGGGHLTIKGNGTIASAPNDAWVGWVCFGSKLTIEDGTFLGNVECLYCEEGSIEINGGRFGIQQLGTYGTGFMFNCLDENYKNGKAKFIITGGEFLDYNPADAASEQPHANYVAPGYKSVKTIVDGQTVWKVVPQDPVTSQAEFEEAVKVEGASVVVGKNLTVTLPQDIANGVTIIGLEGATIDNTIFKHWDTSNDNCIYNKKNLTFKNLNIKENNVDYAGMVRCDNVTYDNCTIEGKMFLNGKGFVFEGCKFVQTVSDYNIWTYGGNPATFRNCEFVSKGKTVHVYREGSTGDVQKYVFENCKFTASGFLAKGAINIKAATGQKYDIVLTNCTATGCKLWQIDNTGTGLVNLTIDGVTTQP